MTDLPTELLDILHDLIGTRGCYQNNEYEFIEVLEHGPALVLLDCSDDHAIQNDMHGEARRLVTKTHTVPLLSEVQHDLHPVLKDFFEPPQIERLTKALKIT